MVAALCNLLKKLGTFNFVILVQIRLLNFLLLPSSAVFVLSIQKSTTSLLIGVMILKKVFFDVEVKFLTKCSTNMLFLIFVPSR